MVKMLKSIQFKLTLAFVLLILVISGMTYFYSLGEFKSTIREGLNESMISYTALAAAQINGTELSAIQVAGDEYTPAYQHIQSQLQQIRDSDPDIKYVYTMKMSSSPDYLIYLVDADYGSNKRGVNPIHVGDAYMETMHEEYNRTLAGFSGPSSSGGIYDSHKWGSMFSTYAPIKDANGNIMGILCIDVDASNVLAKEAFAGNTIYLILGISVILSAVIIAYFSRTMIRDIDQLNDVATRNSKGDMEGVVKVERDDEIGELAASFSRMVASLKFEMMMRDEK
jgi:HAMP domain-containing protein